MKSDSRDLKKAPRFRRAGTTAGTTITDVRRPVRSEPTAGDRAQTAADADLTAAEADLTAADADPTSPDVGQTAVDADQTAADADQTAADADQTASGMDQLSADTDQRASDRDQAVADRDHADARLTAAAESAYEASRDERAKTSAKRLGTRIQRAGTARDRDETADHRDQTAVVRDRSSNVRDLRLTEAAVIAPQTDESLMRQLEELRVQAAADRARAAADRARAAKERVSAARERDRLEAALRSAHLDELTGAYRREMGRLALSNEIDRARRADGRFVLAFVDVDRLKIVNDREGHAAGDRVLKAVVVALRSRLRSFDPIVRYGGDEFVCGMGGTDLAEASRRFALIEAAIEANARVGISVGLAALAAGDTVDALTERADVTMLEVKARHRARARRSA
jgi:diguanylate cyclase (GGDEF)-like protein